MYWLPLPSATLRLSCTALLYPISHPRSGLGPPDQKIFHTASLRRPSCTCCLAALNLLPRSLLAPAAPRHEPVSTVSSPVWSPPFCCPLQGGAPVSPRGFSLLGYILPPPVLEPLPSHPFYWYINASTFRFVLKDWYIYLGTLGTIRLWDWSIMLNINDAPVSYLLRQSSIKNENQLIYFSDSSWQDCPDTSRIIGSYIIFYKVGPI